MLKFSLPVINAFQRLLPTHAQTQFECFLFSKGSLFFQTTSHAEIPLLLASSISIVNMIHNSLLVLNCWQMSMNFQVLKKSLKYKLSL